ncbi:unnamed protein product [Soboliphyme baturini]|uniref:Bestrophin homolog n=1 Tax=Soboliphyme baturini TaxID=241478 RepID=A0A183IH67_9BILA|nr:unnamed protein product [Soboliphyme baturini]
METCRLFEHIALYCEKYTKVTPLTFLLGFYVSFIAGRWWRIFQNITLNITVSCLVEGSDQQSVNLRKTILRYANLSQVLVLRDISKPMHQRYPTLNYLVRAGYITETELVAYENTKAKMHKFWVPLQWAYTTVLDCRKSDKIRADIYAVQILNEIMTIQKNMHELLSYDWITVPLVYTQVVTIAVYSYFLASLFSRQYLDPTMRYSGYEFDLYFPWITIFEFFFYMGWLKVAESIMNPLGDDDDDIEVGRIIDRNNLVSSFAMTEINAAGQQRSTHMETNRNTVHKI